MEFLSQEISSIRIFNLKNHPDKLYLNYISKESPFGNYIAVFFKQDLCFLKFFDQDLTQCLQLVKEKFKHCELTYKKDYEPLTNLNVALVGTDFEISVWKALLQIKMGQTVSYEYIAKSIGHPQSVRAVGNAVGKNPIAYLIPCHRVIRKNGLLGGFTSGPHRKLQMLHYEGSIFLDLQNLRAGKKVTVTLETRDTKEHPLERGGENVTAEIQLRVAGVSRSLVSNVSDQRDGTYAISFVPDVPGKLAFIVKVNGEHIQGSPFPITVRSCRPHKGAFHCCSFCSSGGSKEATCGCEGRMPGGYKGCGHGHEGHPGKRHWSCCGNILEHSECGRSRSNSHYQFTL